MPKNESIHDQFITINKNIAQIKIKFNYKNLTNKFNLQINFVS